MSTRIVAVGPDSSVGEALARMEEFGVHELPVMNNSDLRGWVSYDSLMRRPGINRHAKIMAIMESPPRISKTATAVEAAGMMIRDNVRALPVVDDKSKVVGILSRTDLLEAAARVPSLAQAPLAGLMRRELETVTESTTIDQAAHRLRQLHINQLLVLDEPGRLRGFIGAEDVLHASQAEHSPTAAPGGRRAAPAGRRAAPAVLGRSEGRGVEVKGFMRPAPALPATATLGQAVALMRGAGSTFVAVVEDGYAVGIVSRANIVERLASLQAAETALCQVIGLHGSVDQVDLDQIHGLAQASLKKMVRELQRVEFLNLHYKVYKAKAEDEGDRKYSLTIHLSGGGRFFVQKADDWDLLGVTRQALDQLERRVLEEKELRLERRKGPPRRRAAFYTATPE